MYKTIFLLIILILLFFSNKRREIAYIHILYVSIISSSNMFIADRMNYLEGYLDVKNSNWEIGYQLLMKLFIKLGCSFKMFLFFVFLIGLTILYEVFRKYTLYPNKVLAFYSLYPLLMELVQVRFFLASIFISLSLLSLKKRKVFNYFIWLLLASSFHNSSLFFFSSLLILLDFKRFKKVFFLLFTISIVVMPTYFYKVGEYFPSLGKQTARYIFDSNSMFTKIIVLLYFVLTCFISIMIYNRDKNNNNEFVVKVIMLGILSYGFILISYEFTRIFRSIMPIIYMNFVNNIWIRKSSILTDTIITISILLYPIIAFIAFIYLPFSDNVVIPFFYIK